MYTHLSLFSGIGGLDLAAEMAGFTTVGQCEWADFQTKVLEKHWPDVLRWRDIRTLTGDDFYNRTGLRTVDVISGGFPCQPFSVAGKQGGKKDDRYLWPEMCRVIRELKPHYVIGENVPGILRIAAADVVSDLEREGYNTVVFDYEAAAVGAFHRRERIFFVGERKRIGHVANADGERLSRGEQFRTHISSKVGGEQGTFRSIAKCSSLGNATSTRLSHGTSIQMGRSEQDEKSERPMRWAAEPDVGRVAHGIPDRAHGGGLNEQEHRKESCAACRSDCDEMRNLWHNPWENESPSFRLFKAYGGNGALHEMPCKGSFKTSDYCGMCSVQKMLYSEGSYETCKDMQPGVPCGVWAHECKKAMGKFWTLGEPEGIPRVKLGVNNRVDRIKSLGNAVVPQQAFPIFKAIMEVLRNGE